MTPAVRSRAGLPTLADFPSAAGTSLVVDNLTGVGYVLKANGTMATIKTQMSALDFMTPAQVADVVGRTALVNVAVPLQAAIDAAFLLGCELYLPAGIYLIGTTTLVLKNKVCYRGAGIDLSLGKSTVIKYTGTSDAVQINNPINSSTAANIHIEGIAIQCTTRTAGKAALADTGSTYLSICRVQTSGNDHGIILDQSEVTTIDRCHFELPASATSGVWLVNAAERTVGGVPYYTNNIKIRDCQFGGGTSGSGVLDSGGTTRLIQGCNFNAMAKHIRVTGAYALTICNNEMENPVTTSIEFHAATAVSRAVTISGNHISSPAAISLITTSAGGIVGCVSEANHFDNAAAGTPWSGLSTLTADLSSYWGAGNEQVGAGGTDVGNSVLRGEATFNPANLVDGAGETTTVTVTNAALGDFARASFSLDTQGITVTAWVSAANTVSVRFQNESGGAIDLANGILRAQVTRK